MIMKIMVNSEIIAARWRTNLRLTIAPWLKPSVSLLAIAFSPVVTDSVSATFLRLKRFKILAITHHFRFEYVDQGRNTRDPPPDLQAPQERQLRRKLPLAD